MLPLTSSQSNTPVPTNNIYSHRTFLNLTTKRYHSSILNYNILLMTIYLSTTQYFCCIACGWNRFYNIQTILWKLLQQFRDISLFHNWLHFQHLLYKLNLGFGNVSKENKYFSLYCCTHVWWFWFNVTIYYALLLLMIYCSCSCNWSLRYFYWKSCVTCSFSENVSIANLKMFYRCLFLH